MLPILPSGTGGDFAIARSLRIRGTANAGLYRAVATTTNRRTYTLSRWFKLGAQDQGFALWQGYVNASNWTSFIVHASSRQFSFAQADGGVGNWSVISTAAFRDPGAWYHLVIQVDTTDATATNRVRAWVNGVAVPLSVSGAGFPSLNKDTHINVGGAQQGFGYEPTNYLLPSDGHHAEIHFVDGQLAAPSAFGRIDPATGVWVPIAYAGAHGGANGAFHDFRDATSAAALGLDYSGNGAHLNVGGVGVAAGVAFDQSNDTPTNNHATINPLRRMQATGPVASWGNARYRSGNGSYYPRGVATQPFEDDATGWYCEFTLTTAHLGVEGFGVVTGGAYLNDANAIGLEAAEWGYQGNGAAGRITNNGVNAFTGLPLWSAGQVGKIAYRNGSLWLGIDNTWFNAGNPGAGTGAVYTGLAGPLFPLCLAGSTTPVIDANFGQRPFAYTPPAGFKALNARNMPAPPIKNPADYVDVVNYDGNGGTQAISSLRFQPDFVRIKCRSKSSTSHAMFDALRGVRKYLYAETGGVEQNFTAPNYGVDSFDANGFTVVDDANGSKNVNGVPAGTWGGNYNAWAMKRGVAPGFDIVTYAGNATAGRAVGHALGAVPHLMIVKARSAGTDWAVYHRNAAANAHNGVLYLNYTNAYLASGATLQWNQTAPTSGVFFLGGSGYSVNNSGETYVAYLWTEIPGFSRIGAYTGNGGADGPFVWCGFRPRFVLIKRADGANTWWLYDTARNPFNVANAVLGANDGSAESTAFGGASRDIDILSNGFKLRTSNDPNGGGGNFVFAAFAETPFKHANAR